MFNIQSYLNKRLGIIDDALNAFLPRLGEKPALLHKAMRYSVFTGGKRIRPILCLAACEAAGANYRKAIKPACAIELLHTYTLIHDDLPCMDDDDYRRGKPTSHKVFGEAIAVLTGDALQAEAFNLASKTMPPAPYSSTSIVSELASAAGSHGVVGGQIADILANGKKISKKEIEYIHLNKTASLFIAAIKMGAIAGGADKKNLRALSTYAVNIGMAFQITDDILDADEAKGQAMDETSCIGIYNRDEAFEICVSHIGKAKSAIASIHPRFTAPLMCIADKILRRKK